jgi:hypothetical protein
VAEEEQETTIVVEELLDFLEDLVVVVLESQVNKVVVEQELEILVEPQILPLLLMVGVMMVLDLTTVDTLLEAAEAALLLPVVLHLQAFQVVVEQVVMD